MMMMKMILHMRKAPKKALLDPGKIINYVIFQKIVKTCSMNLEKQQKMWSSHLALNENFFKTSAYTRRK